MQSADGIRPDYEQWMRVGQAARTLNIGEKRVRQLVDTGVLEAVKTPFGRLISPESVMHYHESQRRGPGRPAKENAESPH
jgi:excisionase family DNA binding protein